MHTKHKCTEIGREGGKTKREGERGKKRENRVERRQKKKNNEKREAWTAARHALRTPDGEDDDRQRGQRETKRTQRTTTNSEDENKQKGRRETEITTTMLAETKRAAFCLSLSLSLVSFSLSVSLVSFSRSQLCLVVAFFFELQVFGNGSLCASLFFIFVLFLSFSSSLFEKVREEKTKKNTTERAVEREMNRKRKREQSKTERRPKRESD